MATRSEPSAPPSSFPREVLARPSLSAVAESFLGILLVGFVVLLTVLLRDILLLIILGIFIATIVDPGVRLLERFGIPRGLAVLLHFFVFLSLAAFLFVSLVPIIATQITDLSAMVTREVNSFLANPSLSIPLLHAETNAKLSQMLETTLRHQSIRELPDALQRAGSLLGMMAGSSLQFATDVAGSVLQFILSLFLVLLLAFFLQIEREKVLPWVCSLLPGSAHHYVFEKADLIRAKLTQWAKGQLVLCLVIGILVYIMLLTLGMPYALTLAILAGFTEFIPYAGPFIAAVPAILIGLAQQGVVWALIVAACYYGVQWSENNFIVPLIMKHAVELSPVAIIFAMLVGVSFPAVIPPILGILLSIPLTAVLSIFLDDLRTKEKHQDNGERG